MNCRKQGSGAWDLWSSVLPSGIILYCDTDRHETRVLASVRRGNPSDADGFFLERLAESRGEIFGIEMAGAPPDRVKSSIGDREFLADVFVELFEETDVERALGTGPDFRGLIVINLRTRRQLLHTDYVGTPIAGPDSFTIGVWRGSELPKLAPGCPDEGMIPGIDSLFWIDLRSGVLRFGNRTRCAGRT